MLHRPVTFEDTLTTEWSICELWNPTIIILSRCFSTKTLESYHLKWSGDAELAGVRLDDWRWSGVFVWRIPPLFLNLQKTRGGILHNCPNPKNFRLRRAYKTGFRDIYIVFRLCSPPQAENFAILRFYNAILLRKSAFSASKSSNFRLRRKFSDKFQNLQKRRGNSS